MSQSQVEVCIVLVALLVGAGRGCGNYSNADVDFQLAVPARDDLAVNPPGRRWRSPTAPSTTGSPATASATPTASSTPSPA